MTDKELAKRLVPLLRHAADEIEGGDLVDGAVYASAALFATSMVIAANGDPTDFEQWMNDYRSNLEIDVKKLRFTDATGNLPNEFMQ